MGTKIIQAENFARSAIAPLMSAAVRIANVNWKVANNTSGTFPCTGRRVDARHADVLESADDATVIVAEHEAVAHEQPRNRDECDSRRNSS